MGRILRVGIDTTVNYTFEETSAYDEDNPAATTSPWPDTPAMDQSFKLGAPTEVAAQGCLVTFQRFPFAFVGAMVKIRPTYDAESGEDPYLEEWQHDSVENTWTRVRAIQLQNPFVGAATGTKKIFDLTFFPIAQNIDKVWLTMRPGLTGSPSMTFIAIKLFGFCKQVIPTTANPKTDPCANPSDPFYTGFDDQGNDCNPVPGKPADEPPTLDLCNPVSIQQYKNYIEDIPGFLEVFNAWLDANAEAIAQYCAGFDPNPPEPPNPPGPPNALPPLDLCDDDSIDAFRAALSGDADAVANFDDFLDSLDLAGFFDVACGTPPPDETYVDPNSLEAAPEPDPDGTTNAPFGQGPGGQPAIPLAIPKASVPPQQPQPVPSNPITTEYSIIFAKPRGTNIDDYIFCQSVDPFCAVSDTCGSDAAWKTDIRTKFLSILGDPNLFHLVANTATIMPFDIIQSSQFKLRFSGFISHADVTIESAVITQGGNIASFGGTFGLTTPDYAGETPTMGGNNYELSWENLTTGFDYDMLLQPGQDVPTACGNTFFVEAVMFRVKVTQNVTVDNLRIEAS